MLNFIGVAGHFVGGGVFVPRFFGELHQYFMHYSGEIPQIHHTLAFFDPSQTGNSMILLQYVHP